MCTSKQREERSMDGFLPVAYAPQLPSQVLILACPTTNSSTLDHNKGVAPDFHDAIRTRRSIRLSLTACGPVAHPQRCQNYLIWPFPADLSNLSPLSIRAYVYYGFKLLCDKDLRECAVLTKLGFSPKRRLCCPKLLYCKYLHNRARNGREKARIHQADSTLK